LLPDADCQIAVKVAERLREKVEQSNIVINDIKIPVTLTMGVAQVDQNEHWQSTLGRADMALYTGKKNGRNQVVS